MKPPMTYFGGKTTLGSAIAAMLPAHKHYVEPFAGGLSVLLAKPLSTMETVNDLDQAIYTFWRVLRERPDEFIRACALTPHSRVEYDASVPLDATNELEFARQTWVKLSQSRTGRLRRTGWRHFIAPAGSSAGMPGYLAGYVDRMAPVVERMQHVSLECRPAAVVLSGYASDLYDLELFPDWHRAEMRSGTGQGNTWANRTEVLWSNRPLEQHLFSEVTA